MRQSGFSAETEQRAGELAIINEIGAALAEQLDFERIVELVGDRLFGCSNQTTDTSP